MIDNDQQPEGGLLQSRGWAAFQEAFGARVAVLALEDEPLFGIVRTVPIIGTYLYVPRGRKVVWQHLPALRTVAQRYACAWIRIEPLEMDFSCADACVVSPHEMQPACVLQLDLSLSEDELLARMKSKTRYNIRLAQKKGVEVRVYRYGELGAEEALSAFITLVQETAERKGVRFHSARYYREMFAHVKHDSGTDIVLYVARYGGEIVAANIVTICGTTATYLHGATADVHRNVMAPFLLQWRAIVDAKKRRCAWYDFGGYFIGATDAGKRGITRFKRGFAPTARPLCLPGAYDSVIAPVRYRLYRALTYGKKCLRQFGIKK